LKRFENVPQKNGDRQRKAILLHAAFYSLTAATFDVATVDLVIW
jgi:hypothetical protein